MGNLIKKEEFEKQFKLPLEIRTKILEEKVGKLEQWMEMMEKLGAEKGTIEDMLNI